MSPLKFTLFFGSVREGRFGIRAANYLVKTLKSRKHKVFFFDPEERAFPLLRKPFHHYATPEEAPQYLRDVRKEILSSDAFIVVAAEYNHSMPPALLNALDHFHPDDYRHKPCGIVTYSYGSFGGVRAGVQLRSLLGELGMVTPSFMYAIPTILESFNEQGEPQNEIIKKNAETLIKEVEWYATALKTHREKVGPPS